MFTHNRYLRCEYLDRGGDATVYRAYDNVAERYVVIKRYVTGSTDVLPTSVLRELSVLKKARSQYVVTLQDVFYDDSSLCVVLRFGGRDILTLMREGTLTPEDKDRLQVQVIEGINYLHSMGYIHGDLNLKNVLYDPVNAGTCLIDLCSATRLHRKNSVYKPTSYVCPYELLGQGDVASLSLSSLDIWMLGCVCYFLATDVPLFVSHDETSQRETIREVIFVSRSLDRIKGTGYEAIKKMLSLGGAQREDIAWVARQYAPLYEKFSVRHASERIHRLDPNIRNACRRYNLATRMNMAEEIASADGLEAIFLVLKNVIRLPDSLNDRGSVTICRWLVDKLVNGRDSMPVTDAGGDVRRIYSVCEALQWDLDPYTMYDYIRYVSDGVRKYYLLLAFLLICEPAFDVVPDIHKVVVLFTLLIRIFGSGRWDPMMVLITDTDADVATDVATDAHTEANAEAHSERGARVAELYVEVLLFLNHCKNDDNLSLSGCSKLFDHDVVTWFQSLDFRGLYEPEQSQKVDL